VARKFEWRYANDDSRIDGGNWFENWGDPLEERCLTLTNVVMATKDPVWCIKVHGQVIADLCQTANALLADLDAAFPSEAQQGEAMVAIDSPLGNSLLRVHRSLTHAVALMVDALVECRKGRLEMTLYNNPALCGDVLFALAEATNLQFWITHRIRMPDDG
jgi:hypothetical protein